MKLNAGIISQARMTSTRLPGKVLKMVGGKSLLKYHTDRLAWAELPVLIATTVNKTDDPILEFCEKNSLPCFRGDEMDVLGRYWGAVQDKEWDILVRVTSDCPLIDGRLIRQAVEKYSELRHTTKSDWIYLSNCIERTFPRGFDFEVFSKKMLQEAFEKATTSVEREHVTPYIHQNKHGKTRFEHVKRSPDLHSYRLTVDEPDDFKLISLLLEQYQCAEKSEAQIAEVLIAHPELKAINQSVEQKRS